IGDWGLGNRESGIGNRESGIGWMMRASACVVFDFRVLTDYSMRNGASWRRACCIDGQLMPRQALDRFDGLALIAHWPN
ncbi:hypothetical protein, partial [Xanthomonas arboricola]|uniref:hypothetical protein n=1 Tax=Xanthomonas arboricola TaxID=56448 RepID=UPI001C0ECB58